ncbi:sigma-70 family RNA polymerase sigma factor [Bacillus litorisediminis]|uniref:sigma-70 family RNA polymerase sigma factor n=1 Tax=Bacillus litorisediminis TaxID=2922713 RepID=UPI001FADFBC1|nr:sigma-70 family RNA polymerase sigma factor [Bacillus litorisediminis]
MEEFEQLKTQFEPMIYKIIKSLNIYKNQAEFYQTGLIALWEAHERFDPEKGLFVSFAYTYIRGRMLTEMRRSNRVEQRNVYPKEEFWEMIQDDDADPMLHANHFLLSMIEGCHLTKQQKKWVMYTCIHMLSVQEIAEIEGVNISAVKQWRKGAKEKLKGGLLEIKD